MRLSHLELPWTRRGAAPPPGHLGRLAHRPRTLTGASFADASAKGLPAQTADPSGLSPDTLWQTVYTQAALDHLTTNGYQPDPARPTHPARPPHHQPRRPLPHHQRRTHRPPPTTPHRLTHGDVTAGSTPGRTLTIEGRTWAGRRRSKPSGAAGGSGLNYTWIRDRYRALDLGVPSGNRVAAIATTAARNDSVGRFGWANFSNVVDGTPCRARERSRQRVMPSIVAVSPVAGTPARPRRTAAM